MLPNMFVPNRQVLRLVSLARPHTMLGMRRTTMNLNVRSITTLNSRIAREAAYSSKPIWGICLLFAFNQQRLNSSVMSGALFAVQHDPAVVALLGDNVQLRKQYALLPHPLVLGTLNQLHGQVDLAFHVAGNQGKGKVYFRSTRDNRTGKWTTDRFELELPDGRYLALPSAEAMAEATNAALTPIA
ncbi:cytochrome oxidase complex assembly protein 1-domain-containing protein [Syncephalis plumigaleata]|nr:cytochrome oxidase complex assembly protein 1-domain-containing protein [Syncephalis plumigaleata]